MCSAILEVCLPQPIAQYPKETIQAGFKKIVTCDNFLTEYKLYLSQTHFLLYSSRCTYLNFCVREDYAILQEQAKLWANLTQLASFPTEIADSNFSQSITYLSIFR